jgi:hypothetical protein
MTGEPNWDSVRAFGVFMVLFVLLMAPCLLFYKEKNNKEIAE